jgi:hypothetical protein
MNDFRKGMPGWAQFRQFWSALIDALERYLDRVESINQNKNGNKDD